MSAPDGARFRALAAACQEVTLPGTDPEVVAALLGWTVRPRRSLEGLRRRLHEVGVPPEQAPAQLRAAALTGLAQVDVDDLVAAGDLVAAWRARGCQLAVVGDPAYPARLAEGWPTTDGPVLLVARGAVPPTVPTVAIVGSRRATAYGASVAAWLAGAAAAAGAHVVSGGALGIDAAAHRAAIGHPGRTTVVLGCGHAVDYPRPHARTGGLFEAVLADGGGVVAEQLPWTPPRAGVVRARNRIVAALADVVVVVEGGARSGALLTATAALERDRVLLAVPGDVRAPGSVAPLRLLEEGAGLCTGPQDLLARLPDLAGARPPGPAGATDPAGLPGAAGSVGSVLPEPLHRCLADAWPRPVRTDTLLGAAGLAPGVVLAGLTRARVAGEVAERHDGWVLRRAPVT